jgi:hypothetical protein
MFQDEVESCKNLMLDLFSNHLIQAGYDKVLNNCDKIGQVVVPAETPTASTSIEMSVPTIDYDDDSTSSTQTSSSVEDMESMILDLDYSIVGSSSSSILVH